MPPTVSRSPSCGLTPFLPLLSAGVGRTGTLIALDVLLRQLECESLVGLFSYVKKMRESRPLMVQTEVTGLLRGQGWWGWGPRGKQAKAPPSSFPLPRPSTCFCISASCGISSSRPHRQPRTGPHMRTCSSRMRQSSRPTRRSYIWGH